MKVPGFNFLRDEPLDKNSESFFNFYHSAIAPALVKILKSKSAPHTIGIFGSWGTGKSTIIHMLEGDKKLKAPIFVFDAWKYQDDSLRRTFLIKLVDFLKINADINFDDNFLSDMYHATEQRDASKILTNKVGFWKKIWSAIKHNILLTIFIVLVVITVVVLLLMPYYPSLKIFSDVLKYLTSITIISVVAKPILEKILEKIGDVLLQNSKDTQRSMMRITFKEKLNSPEEFEEKFKEILSKLEKKKLVIVFDNIDRVQGDVAISMISTIKTFMEPNNESRVVFIIPCDPDAIDEQIAQFYSGDKDASSGYQSSEYLRKVFNLIIWLPDYISTDLEEYTSKCLAATGEISSLLNNGDVVLVINSAFSKNPREIIQFVNNLTALTIAAYNSGVAEHIVKNIAYLAKTQVIKQRFPMGYGRLQANWNNPEDIYLNESEKPEELALKDFMLATSRITVDDAEPFIYFKDPLETRGLKDSHTLSIALLQGDAGAVHERIAAESNNAAVVKFTLDMMNKYKGIPQTLIHIYNVQFSDIYDIVPDTYKRRYFDTLARLVDTNLWSRFATLDTDMTFKLMSENSLDKSLASALKTRYLTTLKHLEGDKNPSSDTLKKIVANIRDSKKLFSQQDIDIVKKNIEANPALANNALDLFSTHDTQEKFITENLFLDFVKSIDPSNVRGHMKIVTTYSEYIKSHGLISDMSSGFSSSIQSAFQSDASHAKQIVPYADSIGHLIKIDRDEIKETTYQPYLNKIYDTFASALNVAEDENITANILIGLWWLHGSVPTYDASIVNTISTRMTSLGIGGIRTFFDYWNSATKINILNQVRATLFQRAISSDEIRDYINSISDEDERVKLLSNIISSKPRPDKNTSAFLSTNTTSTNIESVATAIYDSVRANNFLDKEYSALLLQKLRSNSPRDAKNSVIAAMQHLLRQEEISNNESGLALLEEEQFLSLEDKKSIANELMAYLESRGDIEIELYHTKVLGFIIEQLKSTSYSKRIASILLESLVFASSVEAVKALFGYLAEQKIRYKAYETEIKELFSRIATQPDSDVKKAVIEKLPSLRSSRATKAEKDFWSEVASYYSDES